MKKVLALVLCLGILLSVAPLSLAANTDVSQTTPLKIREYGYEEMLVSDTDGIVATIYYPMGDVEEIDTALTAWASLTLSEFRKEAEKATADKDGIKGTLKVDYESHEYKDRFVGIEEFGTYSINGTKDIGSVLYTYNYDLDASKPLALYEVVNEKHIDTVIALIEKELAEENVKLTDADGVLTKDDMHQFVIRDDGIGWLFMGETDIVGVLLSYDVVGDYLCLFDAAATPTPAAPTPTPDEEIIVEQEATCLHDGSHVRAEPDKNSKLIATINANTRLAVLKSNAAPGWHEIWFQGANAYIAASLVQLDNATAQTTVGWVTSNYVHVRSGASTSYSLLGTLHYQDQVEILQAFVSAHWHKIWFEDQVAYVYADYIYIGSKPYTSPDPASPAATPKPQEVSPKLVSFSSIHWIEVGTCTTNGVIIRSKESIHSDYYGKLVAGEQVYILTYGDTWCQVYVPASNNNGYIGYAHTKYFDIQSPIVDPNADVNPKIIISVD